MMDCSRYLGLAKRAARATMPVVGPAPRPCSDPSAGYGTVHTRFTATAARTVDVLWPGRSELQNQLDAAVEELRQKLNAVQEVERNAVRAAMLEERARYCLFIGAIKPLIVCIQRFGVWHLRNS